MGDVKAVPSHHGWDGFSFGPGDTPTRSEASTPAPATSAVEGEDVEQALAEIVDTLTPYEPAD